VRNREAARYARWSAIVAGLIALVVAGVYVHRAIRAAQDRHAAPPVVSATVQQQSNEFSFSRVEQGRTIFTVRASRTTQFKDRNRYLLEDVWITIYGRTGSRNDNIHTHECSYEPALGTVRCEGEVLIDVQGAEGASDKPIEKSIELKTSNLAFNRETGIASTPAPVEFRFPEGDGRGVGITYSTESSIVRIERAVEFNVGSSERTGGIPVRASGSSLEIRRNDRLVVMNGPVVVTRGDRELRASRISVSLDENYHAERVSAEGRPSIRSTGDKGEFSFAADKYDGLLDASGWVERVIADGNVEGSRQSAAGTEHFSTAHMELTMLPQHNLLREMTATGGVTAESQEGPDSRALKTESLRVNFAPGRRADQQRIDTVETLAPATIESKSGDETTDLRAKQFVAHFGPDGHLDKLLGHTDVEIRRQLGTQAPEVTSAAELSATLGAKNEWETLEVFGNVHFQQIDRQATAAHARFVRATSAITLDGSPVLSDSMSRTTAANVTFNQTTSEIRAAGGVISTYLGTARGEAVSFGSGPAHISADTLTGSTTSGHVSYSGHARLWQGESLLDADQIEVWRDERKMQATGHVVAVLPQTGSQLVSTSAKSSGPVLWEVRAPLLTYSDDQGKAHLGGGVIANSRQGSLESRTLDAFLSPAGEASAAAAKSPSGRQLSRVLAQGGVTVRQGDRRGTAEQAEYSAAEEKFVLFGGQPTLTDASGDTTTGRSLTFFVANDTILIGSQEGSRTLTKHRVEK